MQKEPMNIIHPFAAGIDIGSRTNYVAVGQQPDQVRSFGVYTKDHQELVTYLKQHSITHVAMESTGSYWQTLYKALIMESFEVCLINGQQTRNVKGKSDVKDCQWIQKLHSLGLLTGSFLPDVITSQLSTISRHRQSLIETSAAMTNKMQKSLRLMNVRLDIAISDINGVSGKRIIEAILAGERDGAVLAALADKRIKKDPKELAQALIGNWDDQLLYELKDSFEIHNFVQQKILQADKQLEKILTEHLPDCDSDSELKITRKQTKGKNQVKFDLPKFSHRIYGVDLFAIPSVSVSTIMTLISEVGNQLYKFPSAKHFTSWLRISPRNKITGGKVFSSRTQGTNNRLAHALRNAANTVGNNPNNPLYSFFGRIAFKKGRGAAITATARKLATIIWNMVIKKQEYKPMDSALQATLIKQTKIRSIKKMLFKYQIETAEISGS